MPGRRYELLASVSFLGSRRQPLFSEIAVMSRMLGSTSAVLQDLQLRCKPAIGEQPFGIMLMGYEAELHSQAGCARRRGGVPERCPAPQFSQSGRGTRRDSIGHEPDGART